MRKTLIFPDLNRPLAEALRRDVAVVGCDVAAVFAAAVLARRGHRVVWFRGDRINPHAGSGAIRDFAAEPLALPGYPLGLARRLLGNAARGGLSPSIDPGFLAWVLRAVAASRPLEVEKIADDRAWLLAQARPAFAALAAAERFDMEGVDILTLYRDARTYAVGWAEHDVRRRHGCALRELGFTEIAETCPRLSPVFGRGVRVAGVARVADAEGLLETLKADLETRAEVARHWPERIRAQESGRVEVSETRRTRAFDWVVRGEDAGPASIWPAARGGVSTCLPYRERILVRDLPADAEEPESCGVLVDGASGAWLERDARRILAAGAHRLGGPVEETDLRYLVAASYARIWRDLAGKGWRDEGGRLDVACGWMAPDSRPLLGDAGGHILLSAGYGELAWTLGPAAGFALAAEVEGNAAETAKLAAFSPCRFD
jgi:glycine/D-amino acid oxidase-like deaminating enzyme